MAAYRAFALAKDPQKNRLAEHLASHKLRSSFLRRAASHHSRNLSNLAVGIPTVRLIVRHRVQAQSGVREALTLRVRQSNWAIEHPTVAPPRRGS